MASNVRTVADIAGIDDWEYEPWGSAMELHFAICDVLAATGGEDSALTRWDYHRGAIAPMTLADIVDDVENDYAAAALAEAVMGGFLTTADLVRAGDVLERFETLVKRAGRDY